MHGMCAWRARRVIWITEPDSSCRLRALAVWFRIVAQVKMAAVTVEQAMQHYDQQGCLHEQFIRQARATPGDVAVVTDDGAEVTFGELDAMTEALATWLRHLGVEVNTVVGILMERSLEYVVSYIAILRAGGAYLPVELSYPPPLLRSVLEDARPVAVCSKAAFADRLTGAAAKRVLLDAGWLDRVRGVPRPVVVRLDDMAYTVYSSGTTGRPKGIRCPHRGAVFSYYWRHVAHPYGEGEREACNVFFVWEMLRPLLRGVPLHVVPDDVIYDPPRLVLFLARHGITRMLFTPSLLTAVLDCKDKDLPLADAFRTMRQVWLCGEVVTTALRDRFARLFPHVQLLNLYSISECHDVSCADLTLGRTLSEPRKFCPAGQLLPGVDVVVMDEALNPLPPGVRGEMFVGGPGLALGYLNRPDLDAERFVECGGRRLYRTGDWGYVLGDGSLEVCGRCDSMVKIRGYSIETQAVEAALLDLPLVSAACVLARGAEGSDKALVAYVVPEGTATRKEVRAALKKRLPFYMVPSKFIFLDSIPILEASGKLDKEALGDCDAVDPQDLPSTDMERLVAAIWCRVLKLSAVDVHESFFDLGGHSLLATQLVGEMNEALGRSLSVSQLLQHPTVHAMAAFVERPDLDGPGSTPDLVAEVERHVQDEAVSDVSLRAFWRSMELCGPRTVLLTGATGFVGSFILKQLLYSTQATVFCVVRERPGLSASERVRASEPGRRLVVVPGDVSLLRLGLPEDVYAFLASAVDCVVHAAATVNLVHPYHALQGANVQGTQNVVAFALHGRVKHLHHVSTDAVFPPGLQDCREDADMTQHACSLKSGYAQSKWVAEQLVLRARDKGLPATVYRCGNVGGPQTEASWNPADLTLLMLQGCLHTRTAPDIDWQVELTPVDFLGRVLVRLLQDAPLSVGKVFHLVNPRTMDCRLLWQLMRERGHPMQLVPYATWCSNVGRVPDLAGLVYLLDSFKDAAFFKNVSTFSQANLNACLQAWGEAYPPVDAEIMSQFLGHLASAGLLELAPTGSPAQGSLAGRVVLVTGASSGIGAAIAEHLALAGARVALVARRADRLRALQALIERRGGAALALEADVCDERQVRECVRRVCAQLGPVDVLVNCAGVLFYTMTHHLHTQQWRRMVDVNVLGVLNCVAAVLGGMVARKRGHIVNISSDGGRKGFPGLAVYCGTKFFVEGLSQALRHEVAEHGVRVTCVQPGDVRTELFQHSTDREAQDRYQMVHKMRVLEAADVARAVLFCVSQPDHCAVNELLVEPRGAPL
ncbi:uncharacterized protein [Periplaneta americana]|uniref:uncharacterized protein n=1 Tax=Periplaneta americana TaxID=6978 RepID=UPI0037E9AF3B